MRFLDKNEVTFRVYTEDTDAMGIVYHANYLRFFERARTELLRANNLTLSAMAKEGMHFAVHDIVIRYHLPAVLDDLIVVRTEFKQTRATSLVFEQALYREDTTLLCDATVRVVCLSERLKPRRVPTSWGLTSIKENGHG